MSLQNDPRYFPQADVPTNGNYNTNFGKEQLYQAYLPRSANVDLENAAAGPKTPGNGKYVFNPATGQYTWISSTATTTNTTPAATQQNQGGGGGGGSAGINGANGYGYGSEAGAVNSNALGTMGSIALGKLANMFNLGDTTSYNPSVSDMGSTDMSVAGQDKGAFLPSAAVPAANPMGMDPSQMAQGISAANPMSADPAQAGQASRDGIGGFATGSGAAAGSSTGPAAGVSSNAGWGSRDAGGDTGGGAGAGTGEGGGRDSSHGDPSGNSGGAARGGLMALATGGLGSLGGYSDGGRLLRGPGDGVSDSIPAVIGKKQPARLADGEFVVPARIVSELGNGSTEAGARKLYAMMDRIQSARKKTVGKNKVAKNSRADKYLPA